MKLAIMQPYFFPYIGYFQLIGAVDAFVIYDNIKYTKKGWINRNRILQNGRERVLTLPLRHGPDHLDVRERELAVDFDPDDLLNQVKGSYGPAPNFRPTFALLEEALGSGERNLFAFLLNSVVLTCRRLGIGTPIVVSSQVGVDHSLRAQDKVIAICQALRADCYVNPIGGTALYSRDTFRAAGIDLKFIQARPFEYPQFGGAFVPWLSILDVMMFNSQERIRECLQSNYDLA